MNPLFYPSRAPSRDLKSGLEKNRKITKYSDSQKKVNTPEPNLPDSWFYNNNKVTKLWEGLEADPVVAFQPREEEKKNPFSKIEESSHKMKQLIDSYELTDQEILIRLMDLFEDENGIQESDQSDVFIEAKYKLSALINDHFGNAEAQEKMIDSLQLWFDELRKHSQSDNANDLKNLKDTYTLDVTEVASMINNSLEVRDFTSDQIQILHREVVDKLTHQIRDLRRRCSEQEDVIKELRNAMEMQQKNPKRRPPKMISKKEALKVIENCQRSLCEKDSKINQLKGTIQVLATETDGEKPESLSAREASQIEQEIQENERLSSISREIELDSKIKTLTDNITQLKIDLTDSNQQVWKEKQNCIQLETKIQALERQKKSNEVAIVAANEKYKLLEQKFKEKVEELQKKRDESDIAVIINDTKMEYQNQIQELNEMHRKAMLSSNDAIEKRYKKQIADLMQVLEKGTTKQVINELNAQHIHEITLIKTEAQNEIETMKINQGKRMSTLIKHYESTIEQLMETQKTMENSFSRDLQNSLEAHRFEMEEEFSKRIVEFQDKAARELAELRTKLGNRIQNLTDKIQSLEIERDCYQNIIEENDLTDEIPENLNIVNADDDENDDDALADSMLALKGREIEKKATEKFSTMLQAQRIVMDDNTKWEISRLKQQLEYEMNVAIVNMRQGVMENLSKIRDMTVSEDGKINTEEFDSLLVESLKIIGMQDLNARKSRLDPTIPIYEVESRLSEVNSKLFDLTGENEFLRLTLRQVNNGKDLKDNNDQDIVRAMRSSISKQASQMTLIMQEYDDMKARIAYLEEKERKVEYSEKEQQTEKYIPIYQKRTDLIFEYQTEEDEIVNSGINDEDIILRDQYYRERNLPSNNSARKKKVIGIDLFDEETQTEPIIKKRVKKSKDNTQQNESASIDVNQNQEETTTIPHTQSTNEIKQAESVDESNSIDETQSNPTNEIQQNVSISEIKQSNSIEKIKSNQTNEIKQNISMNDDSDDEYEYEVGFSIETQNTLFEIDPSVTPICKNRVICHKCHKDVSFDPSISEISLTTDAVIECPHCHSEIDINKDSLSKFSSQNYQFTSDELDQISQMEHSIQNQIQDLILMKQQIREGKPIQVRSVESSHVTIELQPSLPTLIISLPTPLRTPDRSSRDDSNQENGVTTSKEKEFLISSDSLSIEVPAISIPSNKSSQRQNTSMSNRRPTSSLSARSFVQTVDNDETISDDLKSPISEAEQRINQEIQRLLDLKTNIRNKNLSENKLNIDEMPTVNTPIESIAPNLEMTDVKLEKTSRKGHNKLMVAACIFYEVKGIQGHSKLTMQKSTDFFSRSRQLRLAISQDTISLETQQKQKMAVSLAIETLDEIDISIENEEKSKVARLTAIENNVQALSDLKMFENDQKLAEEIISTARSLKEMTPSEIPDEALKNVSESTKKLLITFCQQNELNDVDIPPLTIEDNENNLMKQMEQLQMNNQKYKNEFQYVSQAQLKLKEELEDILNNTKELKMIHDEIVSSLQQTLEKLMKSIQNNESINSEDLKALQNQAVYFKQFSKEKDQLQNENNEQAQLLKEKDYQIVSLNHELQEKNEQIDSLTAKLSELSKHMQKLKLQFSQDQGSFDEFVKSDIHQSQIIESLTKDMIVGKDNEIKLQNRIEQLEIANQQLMNKLIIKESDHPISYSLISPFVVFDTALDDIMPQQGFTLLPGSQKNDEKRRNPTLNSTPNQAEKVRLKFNQTQQCVQNATPKVIVPRTLTKSKYGSRNSQSSLAKTSMVMNSGYTELIPVQDESQNNYLYVRKMRTDDTNNGQNSQNNYFDRQPVRGSVVLQKTIRALNHRIKILENLVDVKQRELIKLRDQKVEWRQSYLSMSIQHQNARKEADRNQLMYGQTGAKLENALRIIEEREQEIRELRDLIKHLKISATDPILMHQVMSNVAEDQSNAATMQVYRKQAYLNEMQTAYSNSPSLQRYAKRQAQTVQRWEKRRQELIQQQQNHWLSVLEGMKLIHPLAVHNSTPRKEQKRIPYPTKVTKMQKGNLTITTLTQSKNDVSNSINKFAKTVELQPPHLEFDESWKNSNSPNPTIPKGLEKGVVAKPLD